MRARGALLVTVIAAALAAVALTLVAQQPSAAERLARLETGVQRQEAVRAVKRLQTIYNQYLEAGLWTHVASLTTENASAVFPSGALTGRAAIRDYWMKEAGRKEVGLDQGQLNTHLLMQPIVNLGPDGLTAKGTWHELAMLGRLGQSATWVGGIYENDYVFEDGVWKISRIHFTEQYRGAYEEPGMKAPAKWDVPYHFEAAHVGLTIPPSALQIPASAGKTEPKLSEMAARLADLTRRTREMEDETAVQNLQNVYGYYVDRKMWDDVADLFTTDGMFDFGSPGRYQGKAQIRKALEALWGAPALRHGELFDRLQLGTVVTRANNSALARTTELAMIGLNGEYARWELGTYENQFVKENGVWKIRAIYHWPRMITNFEKGWGQEGLPAPAGSREVPPKWPSPMSPYPIYPEFASPNRTYWNPVTKWGCCLVGRDADTFSIPKPPTSKADPVKVAKSAAELETQLKATERALARAIGVDAVENLNSAYGYYLDESNWDGVADLLAEKAEFGLSDVGVYVGPERARQALKLRYPSNGRGATSYTIHQLTQPVTHIAEDGLSAKARFRLFQTGGSAAGASASWIGGIYENTAFFENGEWKYGRKDLQHIYSSTDKDGWAKIAPRNAKGKAPAATKAPAAKAKSGIASFPADYPERARQYLFPEIDEPAFHYKNPVSGRTPKILLP